MKFILTLLCPLFFANALFSQITNIPQFVNFQAIARDANGNIVANQPILVEFTVRQGGATGTPVYCAQHIITTNDYGSFSFQWNQDVNALQCNGAQNVSFEDIPWEQGDFWIQIRFTPTIGSPLVDLGAFQLASVPYSLASRKVERISTQGAVNGQVLKFNAANQRFEPGTDNFAPGDDDGLVREYPGDPSKEIHFSGLEGLEKAAYCRGTAQLSGGEVTVQYPEAFKAITNEQTCTVMLTPLSADSKGLAVVEKTATGFKVKEMFGGNGNYSFDWEVKAVRKGTEGFQPVRERKTLSDDHE